MKKTLKKMAWDATLNTDVATEFKNAELTLFLRMGFKQINPAGGAATGTYNDYGSPAATPRKIVKWTPSAWASWKNNFVSSAEKFWKGKFWLINNFSLLEYTYKGQKYIPNISCGFKLSGGDATNATSSSFHHIIEVVRLDKSETWFGSHSRLYDSLDTSSVPKASDSNGKPIFQQAHVHEVGHLLGLGHVDEGKPHCPTNGNTNARACYGVTDKDKNSVMGSGMQLRPKQANPWRLAMKEFTKKGNLFVTSDWEAKLNKYYPRTPTEAANKKHFISPPKRK